MWSHYGNWHKGVCIVFDKKKLLDKIGNITSITKSDSGKVKYIDDCKVPISVQLSKELNVKKYSKDIFKSKFQQLFFQKSKYYDRENEYRIVIAVNKKKLSITTNGIIKEIILAENINLQDESKITSFATYHEIELSKMILVGESLCKSKI